MTLSQLLVLCLISTLLSTAMTTACGKKFPESNPNTLCPTGFALVNSDSIYFTDTFCVMKYEAKIDAGEFYSAPDGVPISNISQEQAKGFCASMGPRYRLIRNSQWMTIATNIALEPSNWSSGELGTGEINRGHSDQLPAGHQSASTDDDPCFLTGDADCRSTSFRQKRTHLLSNGEVLWDIGGNLWEWVDFQVDGSKVSPARNAWVDLSAEQLQGTEDMPLSELLPSSVFHRLWQDEWTTEQGLGRYYGGTQSSSAMARGGAWLAPQVTGIFATTLALDASTPLRSAGFRCVFEP